jgi:zinc protease
MFDLADDYLHVYRDRINAVTAAEIQRVAQSHVTPDRAAIVVVGDAAEIRAQVQSYAKVIELYDTEGNQKAEGAKN